MNDRFKFRAKLENMDKWIVGAYLKMLPYQPYPVGGRKPLETEYKHLIITEGVADWGMPREISGYEVIPETVGQCTGLKDKNGKLIYEGDIVNDKSNHIRVVVWEQDSFKYPALKTSRYFHSPISNKLEERKVDLREKLTFQDNVYKCDKKHFEVIGNIYENKELLDE